MTFIAPMVAASTAFRYQIAPKDEPIQHDVTKVSK